MRYDCSRFSFEEPLIEYETQEGMWEAAMTVGGRRIGMGSGLNASRALDKAYLDVARSLEASDPALWRDFEHAVPG